MVTHSIKELFICCMKSRKKRKPEDDFTEKELQQLGERIKKLRMKMKYSNYESFAFDHDIPRAQYGRYENGQDLRYSSLAKVIRAFGMTKKEFFSVGFD